jgi:hypothetical protein
MRSCCALLAILCLLASLLVPGIASASTAAGAETRVWAFDLADQVRVEVERSLTLELHPGCEPTYDEIASDSLLAARGGRHAIPEGRAGHIFRDAPGHLPDTPGNRGLLQGVADDAGTTLGTDKWGTRGLRGRSTMALRFGSRREVARSSTAV